MSCGYRFRGGNKLTKDEVWEMYEGKQTVAEIGTRAGVSPSTVKRLLAQIKFEWVQPQVKGEGVVHLDATYFGRNTGVLLALESETGRILYMKHIAHEHISDYMDAIRHILSCGYKINGVVIDGLHKLFSALSDFKIQMCQFHMVAIIRRKLTKNPQLRAGRELLDLTYRMKSMTKADFSTEFTAWKDKWHDFLKEKTVNEISGRSMFTHRRLRSAMLSLSFYLPYLFTFEEVEGMPNTNNMIEGTFTDMKNNLRNHSGLSEENRKRMMDGFFLAYAKLHNEKGDDR